MKKLIKWLLGWEEPQLTIEQVRAEIDNIIWNTYKYYKGIPKIKLIHGMIRERLADDRAFLLYLQRYKINSLKKFRMLNPNPKPVYKPLSKENISKLVKLNDKYKLPAGFLNDKPVYGIFIPKTTVTHFDGEPYKGNDDEFPKYISTYDPATPNVNGIMQIIEEKYPEGNSNRIIATYKGRQEDDHHYQEEIRRMMEYFNCLTFPMW